MGRPTGKSGINEWNSLFLYKSLLHPGTRAVELVHKAHGKGKQAL